MEKMNVAIDSCVLFNSLGLYDVYKKYGKAEFKNQLNILNSKMNDLKNGLLSLMGEKFLNKHKNDSFEKLTDDFKSSISSLITNAKNQIESYDCLLNGYTINRNGEKVPVSIPNERLQKIQAMKNDVENKKEQLDDIYNLYIEKKEEYKDIKQQLFAGKIVEKSIDGEINLCVVEDVYNEVLNHIDSVDNTNTGNFKKFPKEQIEQYLSNCTLIGVRSSYVLNIINTLSEAYRTPLKEDGSSMKQDINSLGVYGDSRIMAEANLAGVILVTLNKKDFILDKSDVPDNTLIREHIQKVNEIFLPITTDALPYTPEEFINGNYKNPTKSSELLVLSAVQNNSVVKNETYIEASNV